MRIAIITDAWYPLRNGVVRVLESVIRHLEECGHAIEVIAPSQFRAFPCPTYPEIQLALFASKGVHCRLDAFKPDAIHIATEGPLGQFARKYCLQRSLPFTTAYHTKFPEYIQTRTKIPITWLYRGMQRFHAPSKGVLAPSPSVYRLLTDFGFDNVKKWSHGVDTDAFRPRDKTYLDLPRPIHMYIGRVAVEKNLTAFLDLDLPGSKVVVGGGPQRQALIRKYPDAHFFIADGDEELSWYYSAADVFMFPSLTDTFGLVMLEALACGVPVAAFPVPGPLDVINGAPIGVLSDDLADAARRALSIKPEPCRAYALKFSWQSVADEFLGYLHPIEGRL
ncbi:MAG: glycosyltransferase family 1 protein [Rhodospirillales bacterium]